MVGMYAEPLPKGFGFSDTAFRVFILMASRRLKSDRFFTRDYRPEVYTQAGLDWIERQRRCGPCCCATSPSSSRRCAASQNPFAPWVRTRRGGGLTLSGVRGALTLAAIRIANGDGGAVRAERAVATKLDVEEAEAPMSYPFRMFGIRTILIGVDLLVARSGGAAPRGAGGPAHPRLGHRLGLGGRQAGRAAAEGREDGDDDLGGQPRAGAARETRLALGSTSPIGIGRGHLLCPVPDPLRQAAPER